MKNLELKARYHDLEEAKRIALTVGAEFKWRRNQEDTYFRVGQGRLKIREVDGKPPELISYFRPDQIEFKESSFRRLKIPESNPLKQMLAENLGVLIVVKKVRCLYIFQNVRIHLDTVEGLGNFLEFEGIIIRDEQLPQTESLLKDLRKTFHIKDTDLVSRSYSQLSANSYQ